jgi:hypothetical protein
LSGDAEKMSKLRLNCRLAAEKESWEGECEILKKIYPKVGA